MSEAVESSALSICTNCGAENAEVFCPRCGEKQPSHHDLAVSHFSHDVVHELVHLDSKLFTTLKLLVRRPGLLTAEYFAGRRKRYIAPLRLFLTLFALQFLAFTAYEPAKMYGVERFSKFEKSGSFHAKLQSKAKKYGMTFKQYTERIDHRWQRNLSLLQLVNIIGIALVLKLIYVRRKRYLVEHLVFASHYLSFGYLFGLLVMFPVYVIGGGFAPGPVQFTVGFTGIAIHLAYLYFAQRRFYGQPAGKAVAKTVLVYAGTYVVTFLLLTTSLLGALLQYG